MLSISYLRSTLEITRKLGLDGNPRIVGGTVDMGAYEFQPVPIVAHLDIKPGSCPNPLNRKSHGVLPVAIVTTTKA